MKIHSSSCCSSAYGGRSRIVLLLFAALLLVAGMIAARRDSATATPVVRESIVVEAESPRAVVTKLAGTYSVQVSDMRDQLSLLITNREGSPVLLDTLNVRASYAQRGGERTAIALTPMNDHLMAAIDPSRAGTLTVTLATAGIRQELTFKLPFSGL